MLALLILSPLQGTAAERVRFDYIAVYKSDTHYMLDADSIIRMRSRPAEALKRGVSLFFNLDISIIRQRTWWPDKVERTIRKRYRLFYFELTRHYRVTEIRSGESSSFRTLEEATRYLGNVRKLPLISLSKVKNPGRYRLEMQLSLDLNELPAPLQIQAHTTRRWRLKSEPTIWPLD